jgi:DNA-binding GntR family transcriptional regulator
MRPLGPSRENLPAELAALIRGLITDGTMEMGARINEVQLAERLEVSRTPLREALSRLASEGFVTVQPRRGFFVQRLGADEIRQLYGIRAILDPAALEMAGVPPPAQQRRLAELNRRIAGSGGDVGRPIALDDRWHMTLLAHCPNRILLDLIRQFMRRTRALEHVYMREHAGLGTAVAEHEHIQRALEAGDLETAVRELRQNMQSGLRVLIDWVGSR